MTTYAAYLEGAGEILASVRQAETLATDIVGTGQMSGPYGYLARKREAHAAFRKAYGDATVEGISDEDDARDLLRDAVNLVLDLGRAYVSRGGSDEMLLRRTREMLQEFKPGSGRHYGLEVGDRVEQRVGGIGIVSGEVIELHPTDNNRATIRDDRDGQPTDVTCGCCTLLPTFRQRVAPPSPSPR